MKRTVLYPILLALVTLWIPRESHSQTDAGFWSIHDSTSTWIPWLVTTGLNKGTPAFDIRYNFDSKNALSAFAGWSFLSKDESLVAMPLLGYIGGPEYRGLSSQVYLLYQNKHWDIFSQNQFTHGLNDESPDMLYTWTLMLYKVQPWLFLGISEDILYIPELEEASRVVQPRIGHGSLSDLSRLD